MKRKTAIKLLAWLLWIGAAIAVVGMTVGDILSAAAQYHPPRHSGHLQSLCDISVRIGISFVQLASCGIGVWIVWSLSDE